MTVMDLINELAKLPRNTPVKLLGPRDQMGRQEEFEPKIKQVSDGTCLLITGRIS